MAGQVNAQGFVVPEEPSIGEKWWNRLTYTGVGYGLNLAVSVVLWDFFVSGHGKPVYHGIEKGSTAILKGMGVKPHQAQDVAEGVAKYIFSPLGGHLTMVPVKLMEDHAGKITHELNKALDPNYKYKDLQVGWDNDDKAPPLANPANKNTWMQVYLRRGIGWAAVVGAGVGLRQTGLEGPLERGTLKALDKGIEMTGSQGLKNLSQTPRFQRYAQLTALDAYLTVVTSAITALTKNTFGKARGELPDDALSVDVPGLTFDQPAYPRHKHAAAPAPANVPDNQVTVASAQPAQDPHLHTAL